MRPLCFFKVAIILSISIFAIPIVAQDDWRFVDESEFRLPDIPTLAHEIDIGDVDNDGDLDIVIACENIPFPYTPGYEQIFINNADGYFTQENSSRLPMLDDGTAFIMLFDMDLDFDLDLFVGNSALDSHYVAINNGEGIFIKEDDRLPYFWGAINGADFGDVDNEVI